MKYLLAFLLLFVFCSNPVTMDIEKWDNATLHYDENCDNTHGHTVSWDDYQ